MGNDNKYWLTPPELYQELDREFHFDFDPCPYPLSAGWNCLDMSWGKMNYVNPPFRKDDWKYGGSHTTLIRKAMAEQKNGNTSVIIYNCMSHVRLLVEALALTEVRSMGRVRWLDIKTKEPWKSPSNTILFVLKGNV